MPHPLPQKVALTGVRYTTLGEPARAYDIGRRGDLEYGQ